MQLTNVENRKFAAYWYAVGRVEAEGGTDLSSEFAAFAEKQAVAYYETHETFSLHCVGDQWKEFLAALEALEGALKQ